MRVFEVIFLHPGKLTCPKKRASSTGNAGSKHWFSGEIRSFSREYNQIYPDSIWFLWELGFDVFKKRLHFLGARSGFGSLYPFDHLWFSTKLVVFYGFPQAEALEKLRKDFVLLHAHGNSSSSVVVWTVEWEELGQQVFFGFGEVCFIQGSMVLANHWCQGLI